ncbi:ankyrin repeat domain-containing protein 10-like [Solea solea]|uniref:ankyrin repeat domain-containing protein 10-like n=1 Tax=Solea solea TaxID=90069 RepID=UPI00272A3789|nr:ankyrin repeat domain-containing protein 10-like [Solea solea]
MGPGAAERNASVCHSSLMSAGQGPDLSGDEVFVSRFPIHRACRDGDVGALVSLSGQLMTRAPLTTEDSCHGWTPLHWAAHYGQMECVMHLVQMGCEVNVVTSHLNQTPMHTAAFGGHPHCVVWLTQAGADVNRQDVVGEAPIHKAARSGSLECIQVLLVAGAKPHLRNNRGQTAADLAHTHGFLDCFSFISNAHKHLLQLGDLHINDVQNGNAPCGQGRLSRKRLTPTMDCGHVKKARRAENMLVQMNGSSEGEEVESMNTESAHKLHAGDNTIHHDHHHTLSRTAQDDPELPRSFPSTPSPPDKQLPAATPTHNSSPEMCGSLHLNRSPSSCVSQRPGWRGLMGEDCSDFQYYGHYHGFGDTAEDLSDSVSVQVEHRYKQAVASTVHLYHSS